MAAQIGSSLLIKIGDAASPEVFATVAGLRTKSLSINSETVDVTNSDSASKMRELLAGAGIISVSASGDGVFTDAAVHATLNTKALAGGIDTYTELHRIAREVPADMLPENVEPRRWWKSA